MASPKYDLIVSDVKAALAMFDILQTASQVDHVESVTITFTCGGDIITVGYGEQAEPAIISVEPPDGEA